nr:hypothetical protein [Deinobacterium chartae]
MPQAKEQIGRAAAERITAGQSVLLDAGSTTLALAQCLQARPLTVITNSLDIAALFDRDPEVRLIVTGGAWDARARAFRGHAAEQALAGYRADWTVLGTCALHLQAGATVLEEADAALKRAMVAAGLRTLLLADHTKRDQTVPHRVLAPQDLGTVVTDRPWPELAALGVQVVVAAG